jgi:hypothetical protein
MKIGSGFYKWASRKFSARSFDMTCATLVAPIQSWYNNCLLQVKDRF